MAIPKLNDKGRMADISLSPEVKITVERRGEIVLIGVNRPQVYNRFDPDAFFGLARAYYDFDNDPSLRAAVFFGHGENFSRGIDVDAFAPLAKAGQPFAIKDGMLDPRPSDFRGKRAGGTPCATCSPATTGARRRPIGSA